MLSTQQKYIPIPILFLTYTLLVLAQWPASTLIQNVSLTLGIVINEWLIVAGVPLWLTKRYQCLNSQLFPFHKPRAKAVFLVILLTLSLAVVIDTLTPLSERIWPPPPEVKSLLEKIMTVENRYEGIWRWFLLCLTPAFCEEIFFRGFFQNTLNHHWDKIPSLCITALAFALIHGIPQYWHLYFILGLYLSWLMMVGQNLWLPILAHLINNSWTYLTHVLG